MSLDRKTRYGCLLVMLLTSFIVSAAQKTTTSTSINVTAVIHDYSSDGLTQLLLRSDDHSGSGQATYTTFSSRGSSLSSSIASNGEWQLSLEGTLWWHPPHR